jgi:hypothetical protein
MAAFHPITITFLGTGSAESVLPLAIDAIPRKTYSKYIHLDADPLLKQRTAGYHGLLSRSDEEKPESVATKNLRLNSSMLVEVDPDGEPKKSILIDIGMTASILMAQGKEIVDKLLEVDLVLYVLHPSRNTISRCTQSDPRALR